MNCNRLINAFLTAVFFFCQFPAVSQYKSDQKLTRELQSLVDSFHGTAGVYTLNLSTHREASVNADTIFPTASIIKVPIMVTLFDEIERGELSYHRHLMYRDSLARGGSGVMQYFKDSTSVDLSLAITLMISHSDNSAARWCQTLAGGGAGVNHWLASHGFVYTRVNSATPGRQHDYDLYGWGQTTPREMAMLLVMIRQGRAVSPAASQRMYRNMTHIFWDDYALSEIPPYVQTASKQGMVDASRSELVMVNAPHGDYVFYVATKHNKDQRWKPDNEAWVFARKVSALLWHYYEPKNKWEPADGVKKYWDWED